MGFSLMFMRIDGDEQVDADRGALSDFLDRNGLRIVAGPFAGELFDRSDRPLAFDGRLSDLHLDPLDQEGPVGGGISHASISDAECAFVYDLCVAAGFMIFNPQGDPVYIVPGGNHAPEAIASLAPPAEILHVGSGEELSHALTGNFDAFVAYRERVLRASAGPDTGSDAGSQPLPE